MALTRSLLISATICVLLRAICLFTITLVPYLFIAYVANAFEFAAKILVYTTLIVAKRQFFRLESPTARNLSLLADSVLITGLICLGSAAFGIGLEL